MKKILAIILVSVCAINVSFAQNHRPRPKMRPHFEMVDSARRAQFLKAREAWGKQVRANEKKWQKHMAWGAPHFGRMPHRFFFEPQEQLPEFVGGEEALKTWLADNITYPMMADASSMEGIEGKVIVTFDVNADGTVSNVKVKDSANPLLNDELVSMLETMPSWIPAKQNGRAVKVTYTLPIVFSAVS